MEFFKKKLLTVITESEIEGHLLQDLDKLGARGYTISPVKGKGEKGLRNAIWSANSNIKVEVICYPKTCDKMVEFLKKNYLKNYAMILFIIDVEVFHPRKFD